MHRRICWAMVAAGALGFAVLALVAVPWNPNPSGWPEPAAASEVFAAEEIRRGEDYARWTRILSWSALAVSLVVACWLGLTSRGARLLGGRTGRWPLQVLGLTALVMLIGQLATLPFSLALRQRRVEFGLTEQPLGAWLADLLKNWALGVVVTTLALLVLIGCARRWRTWWPAIAGAICAALVMGASYLYPVVIEPLFNDFTAMPDGELRSQILALAEGVAVDDVLVADASRRTTTLNAYVSGFGSTRRVVVYDNLVESQPEDQVLSVVAHELAHAKHDDVLLGTVLGALGALLGVGLLGLVTSAGGVRRRAGVDGLHDPRAVALTLALMAIATLGASPVQNTISRHIELRADVDALRVTSPEAMIELQKALCLRSVCDPTPPAVSQFWFGSHPTVLERVGLARQHQE